MEGEEYRKEIEREIKKATEAELHLILVFVQRLIHGGK